MQIELSEHDIEIFLDTTNFESCFTCLLSSRFYFSFSSFAQRWLGWEPSKILEPMTTSPGRTAKSSERKRVIIPGNFVALTHTAQTNNLIF